MTIRFSTGLKNSILGSVGFKGELDAGTIQIYTGAQPSSADAAATGTLLGTVTDNAGSSFPADYLNFDAPADAVISKAAAETWKFLGVAAGTAGWFRFIGTPVSDDGSTQSSTYPRMDGSIAKSGADMNLSNTAIVVDAPHTVDVFQVSMTQN